MRDKHGQHRLRASHWSRRQVIRSAGAAALGLVSAACRNDLPVSHVMVADEASTSDASIPADAITLTPDDRRLTFSSFAMVDERSPDRFRASRFEDGQGFGAVTPGGRLALHTNSPFVAFDITFLAEVEGRRIRDDDGHWDPFFADILINGRIAGGIAGTSVPHEDTQTASLMLPSKSERLIELIWPYERAMELTGIRVAPGATVRQAPPAPHRIVCGGDSITQGYDADRPSRTYAFLLAKEVGLELVNMGFASRIAVGSDGTRDGVLSPEIGTYMIGANDFLLHADQQRTPTQFRDEVKAYIENWFLANPRNSASLYVISPLHATRSDVAGTTLQAYRNMVRDACADHSRHSPRHRLRYVDGSSVPLTDDLLFDGLHPTTRGHSVIARHLAAIMTRA